jgi:hypothetical protein
MLPPGHQYIGFCGVAAQGRYLRQRFARILRMKDPASVAALQRLRTAVAGEREGERMMLQLAHLALLTSEKFVAQEGSSCTWAEAMHAVLDSIEQTEEKVAAYRSPERPRAWKVPLLYLRLVCGRLRLRWRRVISHA